MITGFTLSSKPSIAGRDQTAGLSDLILFPRETQSFPEVLKEYEHLIEAQAYCEQAARDFESRPSDEPD